MIPDRLRHGLLWANGSVRYWLRRRLTPAGQVVLGALVASAVLGFDTSKSMAYQAFAFLASVLALATVWNLLARFRDRFQVVRRLPRLATVGHPLRYTVSVRRLDAAASRGLTLFEEPEDPRPTFAQYRGLKDLPDEPRMMRALGFGRWLRLVARKRIATTGGAALPELLPGAAQEIALELIPSRRGVLHLRTLTVARPDPLGLINSLISHEQAQQVIVLPKRYPVPRLALSGSRRYQPGGVSQSSRIGDSQEFRTLRDYQPGDSMRHIHWKAWARTGAPIVKDYEEEFFVRHALVLDTFAAPDADEELEEAVSVAASFVCSQSTHESLLDLLFVTDKAYAFTAGRGLGAPESLLEVLACVRASHDRPFRELTRSVVARRDALSGCLLVLLSYDDERRDLVRQLRSVGLPLKVAVIARAPSLPDRVCTEEGLHRLEPGRIAEGLLGLGGPP